MKHHLPEDDPNLRLRTESMNSVHSSAVDSPSRSPLRAASSTLAVATMLAVFCVEREAHADSKQACGDAYYAVQVLRDEGKLADALDAAKICVSDACAQFVRDDCSKWKVEIESALATLPSTVIVEAFDEEGAPIQDASATLEGKPWLARLDGQPRELVPGTHALEVAVDGEEPQRREVVVRAGEVEQRVVFRFDTSSDLGRGDGPLPWVLGGVGLAAIVAGTVTGALVLDAYLTTQDECNDDTRTCSVEGSDAQDLGRTLGPPTTALLVGGSVLVAAGLVWKLLDSGPPAQQNTTLVVIPALSTSHVGLVLSYTN